MDRGRISAPSARQIYDTGSNVAAVARHSGERSLDLRRLAARQALPLAVIAMLLWIGWDKLAALDPDRILATLQAVGPAQWLTGLIFTAVSFWAVGRYDAVVHRLLGSDVAAHAAVETGASAIAIAQTVGLGTVTGALVRWRLLPQLGLAGAMRLSVIVSLSFLAAWSLLAALALVAVPLPLPVAPQALRLGVGLFLLAAGLGALLTVIRPRWVPGRVPSLRAMAIVLGLAALDTLAAGTVLWILLPDTPGLAAPTVLAAYLLALGAGLVLSTPGGIGPFEAALLTLLPQVGAEPLLAAIIAYRALYYALPAVLGGLVLIRGPRRARASRPIAAISPLPTICKLPFLLDAVIEQAPRAEAGLLRHGRLSLASDGAARPAAMVVQTGQSLVMLSDPLRRGTAPGDTLALATRLAAERFAAPLLYKSGARLAATARRQGWQVVAVAREAWLDPQSFTTDGRRRAGLRRKLRKAQTAGMSVTAVLPGQSQRLPLTEMDEIAKGWAETHGGERGFSMGVWAPETLDWAHVFLARDTEGRLFGFITAHANSNEHTLDLMRARADAPDGLMYLLVTEAIDAAARAGVGRFSLAAVPLPASEADPAPLAALRRHLGTASGATGLGQFKSAFDPHWEPLYIAAPSLSSLAVGAWDVAREITRAA